MQHDAFRNTGIIVLAGGAAKRMGGRNKALLRLPDPETSPTIIERVIHIALSALNVPNDPVTRRDTLVIVGATGQDGIYGWLGGRTVEDSPRYAGLGPQAGLFAGLRAAQHEWNLLLACDLPALSGPLLQAMFAYPRDYAALVPRLHDGRVEPLHAIYNRTTCLPIIEQNLQRGDYRMQALIERVRTAYLDEPELRRYDPDLTSFFNVNAPGDLAGIDAALRSSTR